MLSLCIRWRESKSECWVTGTKFLRKSRSPWEPQNLSMLVITPSGQRAQHPWVLLHELLNMDLFIKQLSTFCVQGLVCARVIQITELWTRASSYSQSSEGRGHCHVVGLRQALPSVTWEHDGRWEVRGWGSSLPAVEFKVFKSFNLCGSQLYHFHLTRLAQADFLNVVSMDNYQRYFEASENVYKSAIHMCIFR